jgi:LacI family repressor for deo operon, udp, cdd, tsx, nupC, and nupG
MAVGAMSELRARARHTPHNVSVIGFDDIVLADAVEPGLTTVHQPRREIGRRVMGLMVARLDAGGAPDGEIVLPTRLVLRESTGPAPAETETRT